MSELKINGRITKILDVQSGTSKAGKEWKKVDFVVIKGMDTEYPKDVCFTIFGGEKVDKFLQHNKVGDIVSVAFDIESREHEGRYFSNLNAWNVRKEDGETASNATANNVAPSQEDNVDPF